MTGKSEHTRKSHLRFWTTLLLSHSPDELERTARALNDRWPQKYEFRIAPNPQTLPGPYRLSFRHLPTIFESLLVEAENR